MKCRINKGDINRILLTELLPYETPIPFSNEGFYKYQNDQSKREPSLIKRIFMPSKGGYIPYNYRIKKNSRSYRILSVMHPRVQLDYISFYKEYDSLIIHLCSRSKISLRAPVKVATHYYFKDLVNNQSKDTEPNIEIEAEGFDRETKYSSSYFAYKKYNLLLKFYDSYEFIRLEKRFKFLKTFDLSRCFDNIYTHSIAWAIKNKKYAKETLNSDESFEKRFDKLMSSANYNETHGIIIGPEISRIFAEIILQRIDLEVLKRLENDGLLFNKDFSIRRYVDDYFIFSNNEDISEKILKYFEEILLEYKLHINESKTENFKIPFISGITIARNDLYDLLDVFFSSTLIELNDDDANNGLQNDKEEIGKISIRKITFPSKSANKIIRDIKSIIKINNVGYESVSSLAISLIRKKISKFLLNKYIKSEFNHNGESITNFILVILDVVFFLHAMDMRVRTTYLISQIIISINKFLANAPQDIKNVILKKIFDESIFLIKNVSYKEKGLTIEALNLLVALKSLGDEYSLEPDSLNEILDFKENDINNLLKLDYFQIAVILYYIENSDKYKDLREGIEKIIPQKFIEEETPFLRADLTCLFFDTISCPYVSNKTKNEIIDIGFKKIKEKSLDEEINRVRNFISDRKWFINWDKELDLERILYKKELKTPY